MSIDLITMFSSTIMGFVFRLIANSQEDKANAWNRMIGTMKQEEVMLESARKFTGGVWIRRLIVLVAMLIFAFLTIGSGFIDGATSLIIESKTPSWLFGLFGGDTYTEVKEVNGMIYSKDISIILYAIIGYYFGSSSATRRS